MLESLLFFVVVLFVIVGIPVLVMLGFEWFTPVSRKAKNYEQVIPEPRNIERFILQANKLFKKYLLSYALINMCIREIVIKQYNGKLFHEVLTIDGRVLGSGVWTISKGLSLKKHVELETIYIIGIVTNMYLTMDAIKNEYEEDVQEWYSDELNYKQLYEKFKGECIKGD